MPRGFFNLMTAHLTVLNLSDNKHIQSFLEGICNLINLWNLNLSATRICGLPREIKNLSRLRSFVLNDIASRFLIPIGEFASLPLNVFSKWSFQFVQSSQVKEEEIVKELERKQYLTDLSIEVFKSSSALKMLQSPNLQRHIRQAGIANYHDLTHIPISYSPTGSGSFLHLERVRAFGLVLARARSETPRIESPTVRFDGENHWDGLAEEILVALGLLSCLEPLQITNLPSLYDQTLHFPQLERLNIYGCPRPGKLPLDSNSARGSLKELAVTRYWWDKLEWDDDAARAIHALLHEWHLIVHQI
ncbi:hypothetical protein NL676_026390 [Syzygium grande]|nr:hypothetical protein NL676_026390 [Syzygium grande]